jgi:hypothetical protein
MSLVRGILLIEFGIAFAAGATKVVNAQVSGDSINPRIKGRLALELGQMAIGLDESLLDHVQRIFVILQEPVCHGKNPAFVALVEQLERLPIPSLGGFDQMVVVGLW